MKRIDLIIVTALFLFTQVTFAHSGKTHVTGTISDIDGKRIVVNESAGKTVSIRLTRDTLYHVYGVRGVAADLKLGQRIVADVFGMPGDFSALEIYVTTEASAA